MKKLLILFISALLLVSLTACQSENYAENILGNTDKIIPMEELEPEKNNEPVGYQLNLPEKGEEIAVITMTTGETVKLRFFPDEAPKAVYNFKLHALQTYYDGVTFHRIIRNYVVQSGDPEGKGYGGESVWGEPFPDEFNNNLLNIDGAVSMSNSGADSNASQFFINVTGGVAPYWDNYEEGFKRYQEDPDEFTSKFGKWLKMDVIPDEMKELYDKVGGNVHLDGFYSTTGEGNTVFAQVFEGMDYIRSLADTPVKADGCTPVEPPVIEKIEIVKYE